MKKVFTLIFAFMVTFTTGCIGKSDGNSGIPVVYCIAAVISLFLLVGFAFLIKQKQPWFYVLFSSVFIINIGYFILSISTSLDMALMANRISYLPSVFLPLSMLMIILNVINIKIKKWIPVGLFALAIVVFLLTASPGILDIYYKEVQLVVDNGVSSLDKTYGPLHIIYLLYLVGYFAAMVAMIIYATIAKKIRGNKQAIFLAGAVFVNICVWLSEQFINFKFEFLSVSYIISELFLLGLYLVVQEEESMIATLQKEKDADDLICTVDNEKLRIFTESIQTLTPTENTIFNMYMEGKTTKEIMSTLNIKENTLKYHNKNIYSKFGVSSRKALIEKAREVNYV